MSGGPPTSALGRLVAGSAVVTGGGSGIGRAIAEALAALGTPVALVDLLAGGSRETVEHIQAAGGRAGSAGAAAGAACASTAGRPAPNRVCQNERSRVVISTPFYGRPVWRSLRGSLRAEGGAPGLESRSQSIL